MKEKLEQKINEEVDKILKKQDFTLEEIKTMIEIKNGIEMKEMIKMQLNNGFGLNELRKEE